MRSRVFASIPFLLIASGFGFAQSDSFSLQSVQPNAVLAGSGTTTITLKGTGFTSSTLVRVGNIHTTFSLLTPVLIDETTLQVAIPASLLATPATFEIDVIIINVASAESLLFYVYSSSLPVITSMIPAGGLPGTTTTIVLTGTNLVGATMTFSGSGVTAVHDKQNLTPTAFNLQVTVAPDAPLGGQNVTITTPSGSTATCGGRPCTFSVIQAGSWRDGPIGLLASSPAVARLVDGRILIAGGGTLQSGSFVAVASAQIFDPSTNKWSPAAPINTQRLLAR